MALLVAKSYAQRSFLLNLYITQFGSQNQKEDLQINKRRFYKYSPILAWFRDIFLKEILKETPVILIHEAHSTNVTREFANLAIKNQLEVISFPSEKGHILQPLDQVFGTLIESFAAITLKYVNGNIVTNQVLFPNL